MVVLSREIRVLVDLGACGLVILLFYFVVCLIALVVNMLFWNYYYVNLHWLFGI